MKPRYLTKSRFTQAIECPTKLFYYGKKDEYADTSLTNDFLIALAKGGHQVGELARCYHPTGHIIETLDYEESLAQTSKLLENDEVIIFEPAFRYKNLFVRGDVLIKNGKEIKLLEVKAKSYSSEDKFLYKKEDKVSSDWKKYLYDVAFQKYVLQNSLSGFQIKAYLFLTDKDTVASVDGLFQRFLIKEVDKRTTIITRDTDTLGTPVLKAIPVDKEIDVIFKGKEDLQGEMHSFDEYIHKLADAYQRDDKIEQGVSRACKKCQYKLKTAVQDGLKSGFHECWLSMTNLNESEVNEPLVIDIWDYKSADKSLSKGIYTQKALPIEDLGEVKDNGVPGLQRVERQQQQVQKTKDKDDTIYIMKSLLRDEMEQVVYPLNMIDFETTIVAIPFHKGRRPYEINAFQFSHHTIDEDGTIRHASEWINKFPGAFSNYEFIRQLRTALSVNEGTVFRYSYHENSVLNQIREQLLRSSESDKDQLIEFIESLTYRKEGKDTIWRGHREMTDLWDWVKRFYYDPQTNGSNSLKAILPSILNRSKHLQAKYSKPIYGAEIFSHNFKNKTWIENNGEDIISPYKLLPKLWDEYSRDELDQLINPNDEMEDGGSAMTGYNFMQFPEMSDTEREATINALLHYCELDTFAMVLLWEGFQDLAK